MVKRSRMVGGFRGLLVASLALATAGCFVFASQSPRPDAKAVTGPAPYVETCAMCHAGPTITRYAESRHTAEGIRCGQCHTPGDHPDFAQPVADGKCGGCHQAQYEQTLGSKHFASRAQRPLDSDRAARASLRKEGFTAPTAPTRHFVGDASSGEMGGRLCAACHYDEHRLGLGPVKRENFCVGCHGDRQKHFGELAVAGQNRCLMCHTRVGETVAGQTVNTHRFAVPGRGSSGQ
jgi:hypothetical protein